ncbi:MAG TPA: hypothetical protein VK184_17295 [Nostocaceae cyanobacterium]|nr:hypothetical protein [Nostocaceae cyanobacterium]
MTYNDVLTEIQNFSLNEKLQLFKYLQQILRDAIEDDEDVDSDLLDVSAAAWEDYLAGRDPGISSSELKRQLLGDHFA